MGVEEDRGAARGVNRAQPRVKLGERRLPSPGSASWARGRRALHELPVPSPSFLMLLCSPVLRPHHLLPGQPHGLHSRPLLIRHASLKPANLTVLPDRLSQLKNGSPPVRLLGPHSRPLFLGVSLFPVVPFMTRPPHPTGANENSVCCCRIPRFPVSVSPSG